MKHLIATLMLGGVLLASPAFTQDMTPFGTEEDVDYAAQLWVAMEAQNLAGENRIHMVPYVGTDPHGMMLETFYSTATIDGHTGDLIVKHNYGPEGVSEDEVLTNPAQHLGATTVMFRREAGFDSDNYDWFWSKFTPDGSLEINPMGMALAGRIAKGTDQGCIACHSSAEGDMVFTSDHLIAQ